MAALTGKTATPIEPGPRKTGAVVEGYPEASSQTYPRGALLIQSAGYIQMHTTSNVSVSLFGYAAASGGNGSADGVKTAQVYRFRHDDRHKITLSGTFTATNNGATCALSQNTAGVVVAVTAAAASDSSVARIRGIAPGWSEGDVNPIILFTPLDAKIQGAV